MGIFCFLVHASEEVRSERQVIHNRSRGGPRVGGTQLLLCVPVHQPPSCRGSARYGEPAMDEKEIEEKVVSIVAEQMGVDKGEINRETNFVNDLNADSLDTVELVMEFEDEFETSIRDEDAEKIQTVGQAINYIKEELAKANQ